LPAAWIAALDALPARAAAGDDRPLRAPPTPVLDLGRVVDS
jgi:hypothetical protein